MYVQRGGGSGIQSCANPMQMSNSNLQNAVERGTMNYC